MKNTLIIYSSIDGHTKKISAKIAEYLSEKDNVDLVSLSDADTLSLKNYQQIIIGASIRYGNYRKDLFEFIDKNLEDLNEKENAFFSVNVVARKSEKNSAESNPYVNNTGPKRGIIMNIISMKSRIKPKRNIIAKVIIKDRYLFSGP